MPVSLGKVEKSLRRAVKFSRPLTHRLRRTARQVTRRILRKPRTVSEGPNLLPLLIKVLAAFSKVDGQINEEEIDSSLGFLRYDYPEAVYSELRLLFREALNEQQDLSDMAHRLGNQLNSDQKIMLCVQLYDLISKAGMKQEQVMAYYSFMSQLGMAAQAVDIVYQLNASDREDSTVYHKGESPLESLLFGGNGSADVRVNGFSIEDKLHAYRYHDLILLKNLTSKQVVVRGRPLSQGNFCRVYPGQRIILGEQVLTHQDLVSYFNAKKNVSLTVVYLALTPSREVTLHKSRTRESCLEVVFGLKVQVNALKPVEALLNNVKLTPGKKVEATLDDKLVFHDTSELSLMDLRRRARAMGGRFQLKTSKSEYLVSNNPSLLHEDDILLSPGTSGDILLKISCNYDTRTGKLVVLQTDRAILVHGDPVRTACDLHDGETIQIDPGQVLRCDFTEGIIEEERNIIRHLEVKDLYHQFKGGQTALDGISFSANRGEVICVMGASGSGKSTLLRAIAGQMKPMRGDVLLNNTSLYGDLESMRGFISHVPQEDAFDEHLTIEENLDLAAAIRAPHLSRKDRARRIDGKMIELGLIERRNSVVGSSVKKILSGGERKRLNIGLDMIGSADIYLFDEPTSGLSSKDSEHVIEVIRGMSHNKISLVTIHQPSSKLFQMFHKALLLDKGGRLVFFGTPSEMLAYFAEAEHQQHFGTELGGCPACGSSRPEFIFDVLETPLRDLSGDIIYEENSQGQLVPARRYSPDYWRDKYESYRLLQDMRQMSVAREPDLSAVPAPPKKRESARWRDEWVKFKTLLRRAFFSKLRNRANLFTTIVEAPVLAGLIAVVLRYSETGSYDYASSFHIPTYIFLALVVAMFLGLTNSADDVINDRVILQRERNLSVRTGYYVISKVATLAVFALLQCVLFVAIGNAILGIRGMFWTHLGYMFTTALSGVAIGLLISSLVSDSKTAANIVPLILIPQIILGGALIKYEEMNRNLDFIYTINRWIRQHPEAEGKGRSDLAVPFICEFMPMRWSYEAVIVSQAKLNPLTSRQTNLQRLVRETAKLADTDTAAEARLEDLKEFLAILSGLEAKNAREVDRKLRLIDRALGDSSIRPESIRSPAGGVAAEQLYVNQKVTDLVSKAEMEQTDYRDSRRKNIFFGPEKYYFGVKWSVYTFNAIVLNFSTLLIVAVFYLVLRGQLRLRTT